MCEDYEILCVSPYNNLSKQLGFKTLVTGDFQHCQLNMYFKSFS